MPGRVADGQVQIGRSDPSQAAASAGLASSGALTGGLVGGSCPASVGQVAMCRLAAAVVRVVVEQPAERGAGVRRPSRRQPAGVFADQVMHPVPAVSRLGQQMLVIQRFQVLPRRGQRHPVQRGRRVGLDVGARMQAQPPEHLLLDRGQVLIRQAERRRHRQVLRVHERQPVPGRGQVSGQRPAVQAG